MVLSQPELQPSPFLLKFRNSMLYGNCREY